MYSSAFERSQWSGLLMKMDLKKQVEINIYMLIVSLEQSHFEFYQLQDLYSFVWHIIAGVCYIWIQYNTLARACGEVALQRIKVGLIHSFFFLEQRIMMVTKYVLKWPMHHIQ